MLLYSLYPSFYCVYKNKMVSGNAFTEREREREREKDKERALGNIVFF